MGLENHEAMIEMLTSRGIDFEKNEGIFMKEGPLEPPTSTEGLFRLPGRRKIEIPSLTITIYAGYSGFFTVMFFEKRTGNLLAIEAYEN